MLVNRENVDVKGEQHKNTRSSSRCDLFVFKNVFWWEHILEAQHLMPFLVAVAHDALSDSDLILATLPEGGISGHIVCGHGDRGRLW